MNPIYGSVRKAAFTGLWALLSVALLTGCPSEQSTDSQTTTNTETKTETTTTTSASPAEAASASPAAASASPASSTKVAAGNPDNGAKLIMTKTCNTCHTVSKVAGAVGTIGPKLDGIATTAATRVKGQDAETYIRHSIEKPADFLVPKYQNLMPATLRSTMTDQEYNDLVAFLLTLK